jgi:hypothetical protein
MISAYLVARAPAEGLSPGFKWRLKFAIFFN